MPDSLEFKLAQHFGRLTAITTEEETIDCVPVEFVRKIHGQKGVSVVKPTGQWSIIALDRIEAVATIK